jgi:hypothetical protein
VPRSLVPTSMKRTVTKFAATALLTLCAVGIAIGQAETRKLVMGSVFRIVKNLIEVKQEEGDIAVIQVIVATTYINSSTQTPAKLKDISVGDQIVIKVITKNGVDTADQVKFVPALGSKN